MVNSTLAVKNQPDETLKVVVNEAPLKWCSIPLSDVIASGNRIDAERYDIELRNAQKTVLSNKFGTHYLLDDQNSLCSAYRPGICKRAFVEKSKDSVPMFTPSQVTDIKPQTDKYLSLSFADKIQDWFVNEGEILLTCSGTIGNLTIVSKTLKNKCVSQNMIRIVPKKNKYLGYIYTYLKSRVGQLFLTRNNYGAVIQHIDPQHLATIPVPDALDDIKNKINDLIVNSYALRDESNDLIDEATALLIKELNLPPIEEFEVNDFKKNAPVETFNVKLSNLSGRADASYHLPIVDAIVEHLKQNAEEVTTIGDNRISTDVVLPGRFKRVYVEEGHGRVFIGGKQLWELDPSNKKYLSIVHHGERIAKQLELHENMTLITCSGTIGKVALVGKHWENWTANQHIIRVVPANNEIAGYINIYLASDYGHRLLTPST